MQLTLRICRVSDALKYIVINTKTSGLVNGVEVDEKTAYSMLEQFNIIHLNGIGTYVKLNNSMIDKVITGKILICVDKYNMSTALGIDRGKSKIRVETVSYNGVGENHWEQTAVHVKIAIKNCIEAKDSIRYKYYEIDDNKVTLIKV